MAYEIERKYIVLGDSWSAAAGPPASIRQAYLSRTGLISLRVRIEDGRRATLTVKSARAQIRRLEFEYEIPVQDAAALLDLREGAIVQKLRYKLPWYDLVWEIDLFQGENEGLTIAEVELPHEDKVFDKPDWLGEEVTSDLRYSNASLAMTPFKMWRTP
jgi:adenylate cyclase